MNFGETQTFSKKLQYAPGGNPNCLTSSERMVAYASERGTVVILRKEQIVEGIMKQSMFTLNQPIFTLKFLEIAGQVRLVAAMLSGYAVFTEEGQKLTIVSTSPDSKVKPVFRGAAAIGKVLFVGTEQGYMYCSQQAQRKYTNSTFDNLQPGIVQLCSVGQHIAAGCTEGRLQLINVKNKERKSMKVACDKAQICCMVLSPVGDTQKLVLGDSLGCIHFVDIKTQELLVSVAAHSRQVVGLVSRGGRLSSMGEDGLLVRWQLQGDNVKAQPRRLTGLMATGLAGVWSRLLVSLYSCKQMIIV